MQQVTGTLKELDATIVAITPQLPEASRSLIEKQGISFDLLSDPGNGYAAKLGLRFTLPDDLKAVYLSFGLDLAVRNGEPSWTLPMPARFVVAAAVSFEQPMSIPITSAAPNPKRPSTTSGLFHEAVHPSRLRSGDYGKPMTVPR